MKYYIPQTRELLLTLLLPLLLLKFIVPVFQEDLKIL